MYAAISRTLLRGALWKEKFHLLLLNMFCEVRVTTAFWSLPNKTIWIFYHVEGLIVPNENAEFFAKASKWCVVLN